MALNDIFIIDDDADLRKLVKAVLTEDDYRCYCYASAEEFLAAHPQEPVGCLVVDVEMDGISGLELQVVLIEKGWTIPQVFVSGVAELENAVEAMQHGAFTMLKKPFNNEDLKVAVRDATIHMHLIQIEKRNYDSMKEKVAALSASEFQLLEMLLEGCQNKVTASRMDISVRSVVRSRKSILSHFGTSTVPQLVREIFESAIFPISTSGTRLKGILNLFRK